MIKKQKEWKIRFHPEFWNSANKLFSNKLWFLIPRLLSNAKCEIKWAWQRVFRGYDDRITWDLDWYIMKYAPIIIRKMKSFIHGFPSNPLDKNRNRREVHDVKSWKNVLEKIANGFDAAWKIKDGQYYIKTKEKYTEGFLKGKFKEKPDETKYKKLDKEYVEGMKYFQKYLFNLWD